MKKMKGVAASVEYSPYPIYEDQRNRFKHHSLMQDFDDLFKVLISCCLFIFLLNFIRSGVFSPLGFVSLFILVYVIAFNLLRIRIGYNLLDLFCFV